MGRISQVALLTAAVSLAGCGGDDGSTSPPATTPAPTTAAATTLPPAPSSPPTTTVFTGLPLVVDTDLASDDLVALAYLLSHDEVDVRAVTVTGTGEVTCPRGAKIARALLDVLHARDVPVACGRSTPLAGTRTFPQEWRDAADTAYGLPLPADTAPEADSDAVTLLTDTVMGSPTPVTLLTLGPLTNVAEAISAEPEFVDRLAGVVVMGGAIDVPGNVQLGDAAEPLPVEWNLYIDPAANAIVVESGAPVTLVTLDATNAVPVDSQVVADLVANDRTDASGVVAQLLSQAPPPYLWDTLAAIATTQPDLVPTREATVSMVTQGDEAGRTVEQASGTLVRVALPPDREAVFDHMIRTLAGLGPDDPLVVPTTIAPVGAATVSFDGTTCTYEGPTEISAGPVVFTRNLGTVDFLLVVGHLRPGATVEETMALSAELGGNPPPTLDAFTIVGEVQGGVQSPATISVDPGTSIVVCIDRASMVYLGGVITAS